MEEKHMQTMKNLLMKFSKKHPYMDLMVDKERFTFYRNLNVPLKKTCFILTKRKKYQKLLPDRNINVNRISQFV